MSPGRRLLHRCYASIAALSLLTGLVGAYMHRATVQHGYCSEHGEVIHLNRASAAPVLAADAQLPLVKRDILVQGTHDCLSLAFLTQGSSLRLGSPLAPGALTPVTGVIPPLPGATPAIALLYLSPKHSPPIA